MSQCRCGHPEKYHYAEGETACIEDGCLCEAFRPVSEPEPERSAFEEIAAGVGRTVTEKNAAYGDSFAKCGQFLSLLFPDGIKEEQYRDALALVRIFDKMMRIATDRDAFGESPYLDIAGYAILGAAMNRAGEAPAVVAGAERNERLEQTIERFKDFTRLITEHSYDNNPPREALRKCVLE